MNPATDRVSREQAQKPALSRCLQFPLATGVLLALALASPSLAQSSPRATARPPVLPPLLPPTIASPEAGKTYETDVPIELAPQVRSGATSYSVELAYQTGALDRWSSPIVRTFAAGGDGRISTTISAAWFGQHAASAESWRIRARAEDTQSPWSEWRTFEVHPRAAPGQPDSRVAEDPARRTCFSARSRVTRQPESRAAEEPARPTRKSSESRGEGGLEPPRSDREPRSDRQDPGISSSFTRLRLEAWAGQSIVDGGGDLLFSAGPVPMPWNPKGEPGLKYSKWPFQCAIEGRKPPAAIYQVSRYPFGSSAVDLDAASGLVTTGKTSLAKPKTCLELDLLAIAPRPPWPMPNVPYSKQDSTLAGPDGPRATGRGGSQGAASWRRHAAGSTSVASSPVLPQSPSLFIRLIPVGVDGNPVGRPSNVVELRFAPPVQWPNVNITTPPSFSDAQKAAAKAYQLEIEGFDPLVRAHPGRRGCVYVEKNPYFLAVVHPLAAYAPGREHCPKPWQGMGQSCDDFVECVEMGLAGWGKAWDGLAQFYDEVKAWVAEQFAEAVPCEWLGDEAEQDCEKIATQVASGAISAGLVAAGVPPTLPSIADLDDLAKGEVADAAVDFSCKLIESEGGQCTDAQRAVMRQIVIAGLDKLGSQTKKAVHEPDCENYAEIHHALPCFTNYPGTSVRPGKEAVDEPAMVRLRLTRIKTAPPFPLDACGLTVRFELDNHFPGGVVASVTQPPAELHGSPFSSQSVTVPELSLGESLSISLPFYPRYPAETGHFFIKDWSYIYWGAHGSIHASLGAGGEIPGTGVTGNVACASPATAPVQMPSW